MNEHIGTHWLHGINSDAARFVVGLRDWPFIILFQRNCTGARILENTLTRPHCNLASTYVRNAIVDYTHCLMKWHWGAAWIPLRC